MVELKVWKDPIYYEGCLDVLIKILISSPKSAIDLFIVADCVYFTKYLIENNSIEDIKVVCKTSFIDYILIWKDKIQEITTMPRDMKECQDKVFICCLIITVEVCSYMLHEYKDEQSDKINKNIFGVN